MKSIFEAAIRKGGYELKTMLDRIQEYHILGFLTDAECFELLALARAEATPGVDAANEIQRLWAAVHALQEAAGQTPEAGGIPEYRQPAGAHDAYFAGDVVLYGGKTYTCIAPEGTACVWAPDVMPEHWQAA